MNKDYNTALCYQLPELLQCSQRSPNIPKTRKQIQVLNSKLRNKLLLGVISPQHTSQVTLIKLVSFPRKVCCLDSTWFCTEVLIVEFLRLWSSLFEEILFYTIFTWFDLKLSSADLLVYTLASWLLCSTKLLICKQLCGFNHRLSAHPTYRSQVRTGSVHVGSHWCTFMFLHLNQVRYLLFNTLNQSSDTWYLPTLEIVKSCLVLGNRF